MPHESNEKPDLQKISELPMNLVGFCQEMLPVNEKSETLSSLPTRFSSAGLSAAHFRTDWLLNWSLAAKWARQLITQLTAAYPTH